MLLPWNEVNFFLNILTIFGFWPINSSKVWKKRFYLIYQVSVYIFFLFLYNFCQFIEVYLVRNDIFKFTLNFCTTLPITVCVISTLLTFKKTKAINDLRLDLEKDEAENIENFENFYSECSKEMRLITKLFCSLCCSMLICWLIFPLVNYFLSGSRKLPFGLWVPFDLKISFNYGLVYAYESVATWYPLNYLLGDSSIFVIFAIRITTEYMILEEKIKIFGDLCKKHESLDLKLLGDIVKSHQRLLTRVKQFEDSFNLNLLIRLVAFTVLYAMTGLSMLGMSVNGFNAAYMPLILTLAAVTSFNLIVCFYGERLIQKSEDVAFEVYNIPWYILPIRYRKDIIIIMNQAQKQPKLTAGGLFKINLEAFSNMLSAGYQFFTFFRPFLVKTEN